MFRYFSRPALSVSVAMVLCMSSISCFTKKQGADSEELAGSSNCGTWTNPILNTSLERVGNHADLHKVPEGLTLLDGNGNPTTKLDCTKDTVIYIHGWTRSGSAENFENVKAWNRKFNTLIFRWHRRSYDPGFPPLKAYNNVPKGATEFVAAYRSLFEALGSASYQKEIRFVGHSFGGNIATAAANEVFKDSLRRPRRLELLDPAFLEYDIKGVDSASGKLQSSYDLSEVGTQLFGLSRFGAKVVVYAGSVNALSARTIKLVANVQKLSAQWQDGDLDQRHKALVPYYFESLNAPLPPVTGFAQMASGFSAAYPTHAWPSITVSLKQSEGIETTEINDDKYERE